MLKFTITRRELAKKEYGNIIKAVRGEYEILPDAARKISVPIYKILRSMEEKENGN